MLGTYVRLQVFTSRTLLKSVLVLVLLAKNTLSDTTQRLKWSATVAVLYIKDTFNSQFFSARWLQILESLWIKKHYDVAVSLRVLNKTLHEDWHQYWTDIQQPLHLMHNLLLSIPTGHYTCIKFSDVLFSTFKLNSICTYFLHMLHGQPEISSAAQIVENKETGDKNTTWTYFTTLRAEVIDRHGQRRSFMYRYVNFSGRTYCKEFAPWKDWVIVSVWFWIKFSHTKNSKFREYNNENIMYNCSKCNWKKSGHGNVNKKTNQQYGHHSQIKTAWITFYNTTILCNSIWYNSKQVL